jgi:undecaprenyl pyrophosphate phosphatase UppP
MIGWTSRNTRAREVRRQWFASLSPEDRALEQRREAEESRWFWLVPLAGLPTVLIGLLVTENFLPDTLFWRVSLVGAFIVSLCLAAMWMTYRRKQTK